MAAESDRKISLDLRHQPEVPLLVPDGSEALVDARQFEAAYGEHLQAVLDLETWRPGADLAGVFEKLEREIGEALDQEARTTLEVRAEVLPRIGSRPGAVRGAGIYRATAEQLRNVQRNVLFNGAVQACDGTCAVQDTLPITIAQIGVCLVSYKGEQGSWVQRLFRRDLRVRGADPKEEAIRLLEQREKRSGIGIEDRRDQFSELGRRGIMTYAERAVLSKMADAPWRMGHGFPAPYELLTGSGSMELLKAGLSTLRTLIVDHQRFVFVPSAPNERVLLTIGNALRPLEFAIVDVADRQMRPIVERGKYHPDYKRLATDFVNDIGDKVVVGVYRTSNDVPPQIFYAHVDHAYEAALIAMADSVLQAHRGFPMLIDLAHTVCSSTFGVDGFVSAVQTVYAQRGSPLGYFSERDTRG